MEKQTLVPVRLSKALAERLENLAKATRRPNASLIEQAVKEFLERQEWEIEAVKEGLEAVDRGEVVSHDEVVAMLERILSDPENQERVPWEKFRKDLEL